MRSVNSISLTATNFQVLEADLNYFTYCAVQTTVFEFEMMTVISRLTLKISHSSGLDLLSACVCAVPLRH